jgi:hypothetical protein
VPGSSPASQHDIYIPATIDCLQPLLTVDLSHLVGNPTKKVSAAELLFPITRLFSPMSGLFARITGLTAAALTEFWGLKAF